MYKRLTRIRIHVKVASPRLLGVESYLNKLVIELFSRVYASNALPYTGVPRIPHLYGFKNYLNNYLAMYERLTCMRIHV